MKIELTDAKIQRMAKAIDTLNKIAGFVGAESETIVLQYKGSTQTTGLNNFVHGSEWPTIKPIIATACFELKQIRDRYMAEIRDELRRIADGGEES